MQNQERKDKGNMGKKISIMNADVIQREIDRMAQEMIDQNKDLLDIVIIGIQRRGVPLAQRIAEAIFKKEGFSVPVGILDITFYRDDLSMLAEHPVVNGTEIDFALTDKIIILVDDVLYTGRTIRAAIDACMDIERPRAIQLAALVDIGHRELPICANYIGRVIETSTEERVSVHLDEIDNEDHVVLETNE